MIRGERELPFQSCSFFYEYCQCGSFSQSGPGGPFGPFGPCGLGGPGGPRG